MGEIGGKMADLSIITADNSRYEKVEDIIADIRGSIEKTGGKFIEIRTAGKPSDTVFSMQSREI